MKHFSICIALAVLVGVGCNQAPTSDVASEIPADAPVQDATLVLCGGCGHLKGAEACCLDGAEVCDCGLHKGSPGCCKMEKGADVTLCSACGEMEGAESCCAEGAESCLCGMNKDAPGCCLDKKTAAMVEAHDAMLETTKEMSAQMEGLSSADPDAVFDAAEGALEGMQDASAQAAEALKTLQESAPAE